MLSISAIWAGAIEVALTDGAIEVLSIAKGNVLENSPATPKSDENIFGYFSEQSSLQENTVYCTTVRESELVSPPRALASVSASTPVAHPQWG